MFCGKCGSENPDDNLFCGKCGNPLNSNESLNTTPVSEKSPIKKNHTGLIISIAVVLILAIAAAIVLLVIKPFNKKTNDSSVNSSSEEVANDSPSYSVSEEVTTPSSGYSSPEEVTTKFMDSACKGNSDEMLECAPPKLVELYGSELRKSTDEFKDILDKGGKITYSLKEYSPCNSSYTEEYSDILVNQFGFDGSKIDELGQISGSYFVQYDSYDEEQAIEFTLVEYDGKWYVLDFARIYSGNSGGGY